MKNYIFALIAAFTILSIPARAENYPFTPGVTFLPATYPLDVALTLEYISGGVSYCYSGSLSNNTETEYNNITWLEDEPWCEGAGRTKPSWNSILNSNTGAHATYNDLLKQKFQYFIKKDLDQAKNDIETIEGQLSSFASSSHSHAQSDVTNLTEDLGNRPIIWLNTTQKSGVKMIAKSATVAGGSGQAVFYLTDNNASNGTAVCSNVYEDTIDFEVNSNTALYRNSWVVSGDKKTVTVTSSQAVNAGNVLTSLLGAVTSALGALTPTTNGTVIRMTVWCD